MNVDSQGRSVWLQNFLLCLPRLRRLTENVDYDFRDMLRPGLALPETPIFTYYQCDACGYVAKRSDEKSNHQKRHHPTNFTACQAQEIYLWKGPQEVHRSVAVRQSLGPVEDEDENDLGLLDFVREEMVKFDCQADTVSQLVVDLINRLFGPANVNDPLIGTSGVVLSFSISVFIQSVCEVITNSETLRVLRMLQ